MRRSPIQVPRYRHRFVLMQRIQDALIDGYDRYRFIECSPDEAVKLARQFARTYETEINKQSRWRRRRSRIACAKFLSLHEEGTEMIVGFLMVTSTGRGLVRREPVHDPAKERIVLGSYEIVHDGVSWSWRFTEEAMLRFYRRIEEAVTSEQPSTALAEAISEIYASAGFRIVRNQVGELAKYIRFLCRRRKGSAPLKLPTYLPYIKRMADDWLPDLPQPRTLGDGTAAVPKRRLMRAAVASEGE